MTSLMRLNSKMQKAPVFVSVGGRNTMSPGLIRQDLGFTIVSLLSVADQFAVKYKLQTYVNVLLDSKTKQGRLRG